MPDVIPFTPLLHRKPFRLMAHRARLRLEETLAPTRVARARRITLMRDVALDIVPLDVVEVSMYINGVHEYTICNAFLSLIHPGMVIVDIGAHIGQFTLLSSRLCGAEGHVVAVEPNPATRARLDDHIAANSCTNVTVVGDALSDSTAGQTLYLPRDATASMATLHRERYDAEPVSVNVSATTLDHLVDRLSLHWVDLIKLDVEGHEASVLRGAERTLSRFHPGVMVEINDVDAHGGSETARLLRDHGYTLYDIWRWRLEKLGTGDDIRRSASTLPALNLLALHPLTYSGSI